MLYGVRRKIILVDDVKFSLITTKDRLKKYYEVYPAQTVDDMYELLKEIVPDLILLDINMPEVSGFDTIIKLKSDEKYNKIPVIFLSGQSDKDTVLRGIALGAEAHVGKPFAIESLIDAIENVFSGNLIPYEKRFGLD